MESIKHPEWMADTDNRNRRNWEIRNRKKKRRSALKWWKKMDITVWFFLATNAEKVRAVNHNMKVQRFNLGQWSKILWGVGRPFVSGTGLLLLNLVLMILLLWFICIYILCWSKGISSTLCLPAYILFYSQDETEMGEVFSNLFISTWSIWLLLNIVYMIIIFKSTEI